MRRPERTSGAGTVSGLVAVVSADGATRVDDADLEPLVDAYTALRGGRAGARLSSGAVLRACRVEAPGGELDPPPPAATWLAAGRVHGARTGADGVLDLSTADGHFAVVGHGPGDQVYVANDPLGMRALYVATDGARAWVSTCSLALARLLGQQADRLALQSFLLSGYHFGTGVHWRGTDRLEPGSVVRFGAGGRRDERYWRPAVDQDVRPLSLDAAADHCIEVATETLRDRYAGRETWVDLTGGYDSRLLLLLLRQAGVSVRANTRLSPDGADLALAPRVAEQIGVPWTPVRLPDDWSDRLLESVPFALGWGDAALEVLQLSRVTWAHGQLATTLPALLSGGGGEHLQFAPWKSEFAAAGRTSRVNYDNFIGMRMLKPVERSVLTDEAAGAVRDDMRRRLSAYVADRATEPNTVQLDLLYAYKSTGHFGAYRSADDGLVAAELPFYSRPVFEAAFSTDHRHRNGHRLMRKMITKLDPAVAALPTTRGGPALPIRPSTAHRYWPYYRALARRAATKLSEKTAGRPLFLPPETFPWAPASHRSVLAGLAADGRFLPEALLSGGLFRPDALRALLSASTSPGFHQAALLGRVLTVELALRAAGADPV
ncbi:MAG: hypothetical protein ACLGIG_03440 [Actinomycetes bacterium]